MSVRIRYACPHCGRRILHHPELAGHLVICSVCKGEFYEPTDPLPGKPAERALQPLPEATRRLRVPEGNNPQHDLAVLSRRDSSDMRSITEIVEAVLLDDAPPSPAPAATPTTAAPGAKPRSDESMEDFGYMLQSPAQQPTGHPTANPAQPPPSATPAGPLSKAGVPSGAPQAIPVRPPAGGPPSLSGPAVGRPSLAGPGLAGPSVRPLVPPQKPTFIPASVAAGPQAPSARPGMPGAPPGMPTSTAPQLSGATPQQMLEELRRRGLGAVLVTCAMSPMRNLEFVFSENMTRDDALALVRRYLDSLREPAPKQEEEAGLFKRLWKKKDGSE